MKNAVRKKTSLRITKNYSERIFPVLTYQVIAFFFYRLFNIPYDFPIPFLFKFVQLPKELIKKIKSYDLIIVEHPWLFSWIYNYLSKNNIKKKIILVAHNVEYDLQKIGIKKLSLLLIASIFANSTR